MDLHGPLIFFFYLLLLFEHLNGDFSFDWLFVTLIESS
jgi:hypothetical protein